MEEKSMRELSMDEMDKVSGGVSKLEELDNIINNSGLAPTVYTLPRKQAVQTIIAYLEQHGYGYLNIYANGLYDLYY